jgi:hypothetical protein
VVFRVAFPVYMVSSPDSSPPAESFPPEGGYTYPITDLVAGGVPCAQDGPVAIEKSRLLRVMVGVTLASSLAGLVWGSHLAAQTLKGKLETKAEALLNQPVDWGTVRGLSPLGIRLGKTTVAATSDEASRLEIEAIDIQFNWVGILRQKTPKARVTLVHPHLSLGSDSTGAWPRLLTKVMEDPAQAASGRFQRGETLGLESIESIHIKKGLITLSSQPTMVGMPPRSPVHIEDLNGAIELFHDDSEPSVTFALNGDVESGGFKLEGRFDLFGQSLQSHLQTYNLPTTGLNLFLPDMVRVETGRLNSNLVLATTLNPGWRIDGTSLDVQGTAILNTGTVRLGQLPLPVDHVRSSLWFQGQQVNVYNTGLQIGDLSLGTQGTVSLAEGYNLLAQIPAITGADIQNVIGQPLPVNPDQAFHWQARITGPLKSPAWEADLPESQPLDRHLSLNPKVIGVSLGMGMMNLPMRDRIPLIEGATYEFRGDGAWFTLTDGTVVPPLSKAAYQQGSARLGSTLSPNLDLKFFWFLQTNPYITAIAADLGRGKLREFLNGNTFDTDRFFLDYFIPVYRETSYAAGLDPGEALWMLDHSLRTLQDPLLRKPDATPIVTGSGPVGSFWEDEQSLSMQQLILRPQVAQTGGMGALARFALITHLDHSMVTQASRQLASVPEVMSKIPNVTYGAEEGAIAHALGMAQLQGVGIYSEHLRALGDRIVQNEFEKQRLRSAITEQMDRLSIDYQQALGNVLANFSAAEWASLGLSAHLNPETAAQINGTNTLSILVSRNEKAGYPLNQAYQNSRRLLLELLQDRDPLPQQQRLLYAILKDQSFNPQFWDRLSQKLPQLSEMFITLSAAGNQYRKLAIEGSALHEQFYAAMVQEGQDISVNAAIKHAVGFQAHLARLLDQALIPTDPSDPRYLAFRRSLAIYLRESPDISVYGGTEAALRLYGYETLNVQEMLAVDVSSAPRIRALSRLYSAARKSGLIDEWDIPGFQRILLTGALMAAGVERQQLPSDLAAVVFPGEGFRRDLLFAVGVEGIKLEATRLGVQAHDHRVSFQPVGVPDYRAPSFDVTDDNACPTQPAIQAIALGPKSEFVWYPTIQRVVLKRGDRECPLADEWSTLFFDTLLESVPVHHSPEGAAELQGKLRTAQLLEAGIF